jgi:hypothetical protein
MDATSITLLLLLQPMDAVLFVLICQGEGRVSG